MILRFVRYREFKFAGMYESKGKGRKRKGKRIKREEKGEKKGKEREKKR